MVFISMYPHIFHLFSVNNRFARTPTMFMISIHFYVGVIIVLELWTGNFDAQYRLLHQQDV